MPPFSLFARAKSSKTSEEKVGTENSYVHNMPNLQVLHNFSQHLPILSPDIRSANLVQRDVFVVRFIRKKKKKNC